MLVRSNSPISSVEGEDFKQFMGKWTQKALPSESTLRKNCTGEVNNNLVPADAYNFKNAPIVSVGVERGFSYMNQLLSPQRQRLTTEHICWHLVIRWNDSVDADKSDL